MGNVNASGKGDGDQQRKANWGRREMVAMKMTQNRMATDRRSRPCGLGDWTCTLKSILNASLEGVGVLAEVQNECCMHLELVAVCLPCLHTRVLPATGSSVEDSSASAAVHLIKPAS